MDWVVRIVSVTLIVLWCFNGQGDFVCFSGLGD